MSEPAPAKRICPHCGKEIPKLPPKPRDLGLLLNTLLYRVPPDQEITPAWIEKVRQHCRMKPERLVELQNGLHARHWPRMLERRAARLAYFKEHGEFPPRDKPLLPGEPDRSDQIHGFDRYRNGGLAKLKARIRKRPTARSDKLMNRYLATKKIRSKSRRHAALDNCLARWAADMMARTGKLSLVEYDLLQMTMLEDGALPRRFRRKDKMGQVGGAAEKNAREEP